MQDRVEARFGSICHPATGRKNHLIAREDVVSKIAGNKIAGKDAGNKIAVESNLNLLTKSRAKVWRPRSAWNNNDGGVILLPIGLI